MTARKIDFPDTEAQDFDPDEPFVASNGNTYVYNGWGWELVCDHQVKPDIKDIKELKMFAMQLRGDFQLDADGKAVPPDNSYWVADENNPDGWPADAELPGVWWINEDGLYKDKNCYYPSKVTHLMVSENRWAETVDEDGNYLEMDVRQMEPFYQGDIIRVKAKPREFWDETLSNGSSKWYGAEIFDDVWKIIKVLKVTDNPTWGKYTSLYAYEVEKVRPKDEYWGHWYIYDLESETDLVKNFYPCEVSNEYTGEKAQPPYFQFNPKTTNYEDWNRGRIELTDSRGYLITDPTAAVAVKVSKHDLEGWEMTEELFPLGERFSIFEKVGDDYEEVCSFIPERHEWKQENGRTYLKIHIETGTGEGRELLTDLALIPNIRYTNPVSVGSANISLMRVSQGNKAVWLGNKQDPPEADPDGKVGWYYRNPGVDSRKAHWTLWSQETNAHKHITLGDLKSLSLLIQGTSELPYIQVYTKRQNDGQDAGTTYRSRITWQPPANSGGLQSEVFVTTNPDTELYVNINRLEFEHEEWNDKGPLGDDEQISKIIVSTNSTSPEGTYEFLLQAMVVETAIGTFEMQVEITGATGNVPEQMVFYGAAPPDAAPKGAIFTDENTLKVYVHQGDGVWIEHTTCVGSGEGGDSTDSPWVRIDDWRVVREYNGFVSSSPDGFCAKILLWDVPCNESKPHTLTQEWEWDEVGNDNWVAYDPETDPNAYAENYQRDWYWRYGYAPEDYDGNGMDASHPFPCAKVRCRVKNEWDSGEFEYSDWVEFWIGRAAAPVYDHPHQPPTIC